MLIIPIPKSMTSLTIINFQMSLSPGMSDIMMMMYNKMCVEIECHIQYIFIATILLRF